MKRKTTTVTEEFDKEGNLVNKITETTEEEDSGYIYPQHYCPNWPFPKFDVTCNVES